MERITIVGTGPISASIGLRLVKADSKNTEVVATSGDRVALTRFSKIGAAHKTVGNLGSAIKGATIVLLDTQITETRELLETIGPILDDGCVVTDIGISKTRMMEWAEEYLPRGVSYVGGHPLIKKQPTTLDDADPSLFDDIRYCIIPSRSADQQSVRVVVGLVEKLGAKPLFLDPQEHDSYAAAMSYLPIVLSAAYVNATTGSSGWREMHRLAASEFGELSRLVSEDPLNNEAACLANPDELVYWLDQLIAELYSYRNQIKERSDDLVDSLIKAWEAQARWEADAIEEPQRPELPSASQSMAAALLGERLARRYQQMQDRQPKKTGWKYFRKS